MLSSRRQDPILHSSHSVIPLLVVLTLSGALGACGDSDSPLAPGGADEAPTPPSGPTTPDYAVTAGTSQRIVFNSARKGGYDIFKMDPLGYNVVPLTQSAYAGEPAWSHDNSHIAMVRQRQDANKVWHTDIYVINADGSSGHWARSTPFPYNLRYPSWSHDGSRILLTIQQMGKPYLATLTLATGQVKFITSGGVGVQGNYPSYDPTGTKIVFVSPSGTSLQQIKTDGTGRQILASFGKTISSPRFSPDGGKIAFEMLVGLNIDIYVWNLSTKIQTRLTTHADIDEQATWSPDGSRIAFMSMRSGQAQIWVMSANGGTQVRITHTNTAEKDPMWSH
jgi:Tol biopolymer transport system component